jgi:phosphatidylcholine synthase
VFQKEISLFNKLPERAWKDPENSCLNLLYEDPLRQGDLVGRKTNIYIKVLAIGVHFLTASGAVAGIFALNLIAAGDFRSAFLYLFVAMGIDMVDGTLARSARVKEVMPGFDGALLDNIIDYFNYTVVPAFYVQESGLFTAPWNWIFAAMVLLSSAYQFCQADAKTSDHFFKGFPSYWNIVVFYFLLLDAGALAAGAVLIICTILVFVPLLYVYPSRMSSWKGPTIILTGLFSLLLLWELYIFPAHSVLLTQLSLVYVVYYFVISLVLGFRRAGKAGE